MNSYKEPDGSAMGTMLVLCLIWGLQQVALKAASGDVSPLMQAALRSGIAAILMGILMAVRGESLNLRRGAWRPSLIVGLLFALELLLVAEGLRFTSASHLIVFLYTGPIFTAVVLQLKVPEERLTPTQWLGTSVAFAGIAISFLGRNGAIGETRAPLLGDVLALLAGIVWAARTVALRSSELTKETATRTVLYQLVVAFVTLTAAAAVLGQTMFKPSAIAWSSLFFQSVFVAFASFLAWLWLLRRYIASRLGAFSLLTPLFGVAFGVLLLGETVEPIFLVGAVMVMSGIALVSGSGWIYRLFAKQT